MASTYVKVERVEDIPALHSAGLLCWWDPNTDTFIPELLDVETLLRAWKARKSWDLYTLVEE